MKYRIFFITVIALFILHFSADAETNGGYAGAFLRMGLGAEAIAQGDAFTARASNGFGGYYNPAGLAFIQRRIFAASYSNLTLDRAVHYVGLTFPLKPTAGVSIGWINAGVSNIDGRDFDGNHYGTLNFHQNAFIFAFANRFTDKVSVGIGAKILYALFPEMLEEGKALKSSGVGFDAGILVKLVEKLQVGLQVRDINGKFNWDTSEYWSKGLSKTDNFPTVMKIGVAAFPNQNLALEYDLEASSQDAVEHHFGTEYAAQFKPGHIFALRAGYDFGTMTFGFGYEFPLAGTASRLDMAYLLEDVAPDDTMIFSWSLLF